MRQEYSRTAEAMAFLRALEQHQPADKRIIDDAYAATFLFHGYYQWIIKRPWAVRLVSGFLRRWAPGGQELLTIRPRLVDDLIKAEAANGLQQVVILGAGFDTHAWRCREALRDVTVFEIDHPATQQAKREQSLKVGLPDNLRFVPVDFEKDDFAECLALAGFDAARSTFFVWVGVSYYLTPAAVTATLQRIATISRVGTKLVWDYLLAEVVDGTSTNNEALAKARRVAQLGEPWLFGLPTKELGRFVKTFGFQLLKDFEPDELQGLYAATRQLPMSYVRMVVCERALQ